VKDPRDLVCNDYITLTETLKNGEIKTYHLPDPGWTVYFAMANGDVRLIERDIQVVKPGGTPRWIEASTYSRDNDGLGIHYRVKNTGPEQEFHLLLVRDGKPIPADLGPQFFAAR
jgi:hypothetical protein